LSLWWVTFLLVIIIIDADHASFNLVEAESLLFAATLFILLVELQPSLKGAVHKEA
jgi:hypothetical protein